jgi:predicted extracellular nuclease
MRFRSAWILFALVAAVAAPALIGTAKADIIDCTIRDLQDTSSVMWDTLITSGTTPDTLRMAGVVTGADTKPTGLGFYIEDFGLSAQNRGLDVFTGSHNAYADSGLVRGQLVRVTGRPTEFNGLSELISMNGARSATRSHRAHPVFQYSGPTIVSASSITDVVLAEPWRCSSG